MSRTVRLCVMKNDLFDAMVSLEHLFACWDEFKCGKRKKKDLQSFERSLEDHIFELHQELTSFQYRHGSYEQFRVFEPKERSISRASVKDRLVHHMLYVTLTKIFDRTFIFHSLSCRLGKGVHKGISYFEQMVRQVSQNGTGSCYALKMDIRRFFDHVNHSILKALIRKKVHDEKVLYMADLIIDSFKKGTDLFGARGMPLGNVTSQLFANIYLHELDDFIKQKLRDRFYLRYCDDFVILSRKAEPLLRRICQIEEFLETHLRLELHPKKVILSKLSQGIDFLGYVMLPHHIRLRMQTRRRLKRRLKEAYKAYQKDDLTYVQMDQKIQSYLGILSHANEFHFSQAIKNAYWIRKCL